MPHMYAGFKRTINALRKAGFSVDPYYNLVFPSEAPKGYPTLPFVPEGLFQGSCGVPRSLGVLKKDGKFEFFDGEEPLYRSLQKKVAEVLDLKK